MRFWWMAAALFGVLIASDVAADAQVPVASAGGPAVVRLSRQWDFVSKVNGKTYSVHVAMPYLPPPPGGYPVVYVLDGDAYFNSFADAARSRAAFGLEIAPAIIVGIGYPQTDSVPTIFRRRTGDLTPSVPDAATRAINKAAFGGESEYAGANQFLRIIQTEVAPKVAAIAAVDARKAVLFGHSLGGLFVLHTLLTHPDAFQTYIALSPSIWWDGRIVLRDEAAFSAKVAGGTIAPRVFIGVGALEQTATTGPLPPGTTREKFAADIARSAMVDNARALASRLGALRGGPGYAVGFKVFDGQSHIAVPWASLNTVLDFALPLAPQAKS